MDKSEKLKKANNIAYDQGLMAARCEEEAKEVKGLTSYLWDQMSSLKEQMSSLSNLVETINADCTKTYLSKVSFVISNLKTQVEKFDLFVPYYTLMSAF